MNTRTIHVLAVSTLTLATAVLIAAQPAHAQTPAEAPASAAVAGATLRTPGKPADSITLTAADLAALPAVAIDSRAGAGAFDSLVDAPAGVDGLNAVFGPYYNYVSTGCQTWQRYTWDLRAGTTIDVRVDGASALDPGLGSSGMDPIVSMYNAAGGHEATDDDSGGGSSALLSRRVLVGQTFSFVVRSYNNGSSGPFRITFSTR